MKFFITGWCCIPHPYLNDDSLRDAKECGLDVLLVEYSTENNLAAMDLLAKHGLEASVLDSRIGQCVSDPSKIDELIPAIAADYRNHPALHDYHITDEPSCAAFPTLARIVAKLKECDPDHPAYINLFPNYACAAALGAPTYDEHVQRFLDEVKPEILSYDHYHFLTETPFYEEHSFDNDRDTAIFYDAQRRSNRAGFFENLETIRREGLRAGVPYMLIVLLTEHGPYRYLTREELAWEVYQSLAYGVSAVSYFTYWTPPYNTVWHWKNGIISSDGQKTEHYYDAQAISHEIRLLGDYLAATHSTAVFHAGEETEQITHFPENGHGKIRKITGGRFTVGFFETGDFLIVNKDFRSPAVCTVDAGGAALEQFNKETGIWEAVSPSLEIPAGNAVLLRCRS